MSVAYGSIAAPQGSTLDFLPLPVTLKDGTTGFIDRLREPDFEFARGLLNAAIEEGQTYPQLEQLDDKGFRAYFLSSEAFALKKSSEPAAEPLGIFYIKPNFPGRCNHTCNGGFLVAESSRNKGCGRVMGEAFLKLAKALGYRAAMFNLVFETNVPSVKLWRGLGFKEIGRIPGAGNLKGLGYVDAIMFHYDLTQIA
eukprot:m.237234 g.237234  ORF g.237234 m.237234 type:complete len:197 (+) comp21008_c0_seq1:146-736(+)